jgi:hypothetical protein
MARTSFGFGLVITASMTESLLAAADDCNFPLTATVSRQRPPQNSPGKDRLLEVGCWLRRELLRTSVAVLRTGAAGQVSCFCALRVPRGPIAIDCPETTPNQSPSCSASGCHLVALAPAGSFLD